MGHLDKYDIVGIIVLALLAVASRISCCRRRQRCRDAFAR
jgi:hypothetical protein